MDEYLFTVWVISVFISGSVLSIQWTQYCNNVNTKRLKDNKKVISKSGLVFGAGIVIFTPILNSFIALLTIVRVAIFLGLKK